MYEKVPLRKKNTGVEPVSSAIDTTISGQMVTLDVPSQSRNQLGGGANSYILHAISKFIKRISIRLELGLGFGFGSYLLSLSPYLEERFKDGISLMEVVMDNVHEIESVHHFSDYFMRRR